MTVHDADILAAAKREGAQAARLGKLPTANPHTDAELSTAWFEGFRSAWSEVLSDDADKSGQR